MWRVNGYVCGETGDSSRAEILTYTVAIEIVAVVLL